MLRFVFPIVYGLAACSMEPETMPRIRRTTADGSAGGKVCTPKSTSGFNVIGGTAIDEKTYPFSKELQIRFSSGGGGSCSGTFVSSNVYISAAHCVYSSSGTSTFTVNGVKATKAIHNPSYQTGAGSLLNTDISVIIFPPNTSKDYTPLADRAGKVGDEVILVGFGPQNVQADDMGKRYGKTKVTSITFNGMLSVSYQQGSGAISAPGDSGGTVLLDGKLVATMTGGDEQSVSELSHVMATENLDFLRKVKQDEKIEICGLDGYACGGTGTGTGGTPEKPPANQPTSPTPQNPLPPTQTGCQ